MLPQIHNIGISFQHHALAAKIREVTRPHTEKATLLEYIHTTILIYSLSFTRLIVRTCLDFNVYSFPPFLRKICTVSDDDLITNSDGDEKGDDDL